MATEFSREFFSANRIVKADLRAARQPREDDITRIKAEVKKLYDATEVLLNITVDESLLSPAMSCRSATGYSTTPAATPSTR